jgi:hypothetical protein
MPAQAGIQKDSALVRRLTSWIPAFAGMTFLRLSSKTFLTDYYRQLGEAGRLRSKKLLNALFERIFKRGH